MDRWPCRPANYAGRPIVGFAPAVVNRLRRMLCAPVLRRDYVSLLAVLIEALQDDIVAYSFRCLVGPNGGLYSPKAYFVNGFLVRTEREEVVALREESFAGRVLLLRSLDDAFPRFVARTLIVISDSSFSRGTHIWTKWLWARFSPAIPRK